jgi:NarL family two-component system response regulator LiaR
VGKIRVIIADDHPAFRAGLCRCLRDEKDIDVIAEAGDGDEAVKLAEQLQPDVIIIDVSMPKLNGIEAAKQIRAACPNMAILTVSAFSQQSYIIDSMRAGTSGYLLKTASLPEIISSIRLVHTGHTIFDLKAATSILRKLSSQDSQNNVSQVLAKRQLEMLKLTAKGLSNKEIAAELAISERTVQTHLGSLYKKLGVGSRTEAVLSALKEGLITIDDLPSRDGHSAESA